MSQQYDDFLSFHKKEIASDYIEHYNLKTEFENYKTELQSESNKDNISFWQIEFVEENYPDSFQDILRQQFLITMGAE